MCRPARPSHCAGRALLVRRTALEWRRLLGLAALLSAVAGCSTGFHVPYRMEGFPGVAALLVSTKRGLHEHALDALAIACSWTDAAGPWNGRGTSAAPVSAHPDAGVAGEEG